MQVQTTILCILDGLGLNPNSLGNAFAQANTPTLDRLFLDYPFTTLETHGPRVGLPTGQMGNSEVGHLNIGAGRVVEQWPVLIERSLNEKQHLTNPAFLEFTKATKASKQIHLIGLLSHGGVHSDSQHLLLMLDSLLATTQSNLCLHIISDGRDVSPTAALADLTEILQFISDKPRIQIYTLQGRFFAMDRDQRWERVQSAYTNVTGLNVPTALTPVEYIAQSYSKGITDEFIEPVSFMDFSILPTDGIVFWNYRADRMREIVSALCITDFSHFARTHPLLPAAQILCFSNYSSKFNLPYLFAQESLKNTLGEVVSQAGLKQIRIAETEKYPHVTYFLNGGRETVLAGEERKLLPSPRDVKTYDLKPQMAALEVRDEVLKAIECNLYHLIVVNFANCDMVGHTGVMSAAILAVETVDQCLSAIVACAQNANANLLVIADHGNVEQLINYSDGSPHTAHTTYPVPCILVAPDAQELRSGGALCDVAPTILQLMRLDQPKDMTGESLIRTFT